MITIEELKRVPIFNALTEEELRSFLPNFREKKFPKNSIIFSQDEEGDTFFFIVNGKVKIVIMSKDGREVILSTLGKNEFFGEMSLIDGLPRSATVVAMEDTTLIFLKRNDFLAKLKEHPSMMITMMQEMSRRMRKADERIGSLSLLSVYGRVARVLLEIAKENGKKIPNGYMIEHRPTQNDIACMAGTTRETVTRIMSDLVRRGLISMEGKGLIIYGNEADFEDF